MLRSYWRGTWPTSCVSFERKYRIEMPLDRALLLVQGGGGKLSIFGVDIASGSPSGRREPSYSMVILDGDEAAGFHMISRHKLIRLIRERQPEIVAMDNLHELASDRRELINILRRMPAATRMVQVTGARASRVPDQAGPLPRHRLRPHQAPAGGGGLRPAGGQGGGRGPVRLRGPDLD